MSNEERRQLTLDDPVGPEVLENLMKLGQATDQVAHRLLRLEQERIQLLALAKSLDLENNKIFAAILAERGLPQNTPVDLDQRTGKLSLQLAATTGKAAEEQAES